MTLLPNVEVIIHNAWACRLFNFQSTVGQRRSPSRLPLGGSETYDVQGSVARVLRSDVEQLPLNGLFHSYDIMILQPTTPLTYLHNWLWLSTKISPFHYLPKIPQNHVQSHSAPPSEVHCRRRPHWYVQFLYSIFVSPQHDSNGQVPLTQFPSSQAPGH